MNMTMAWAAFVITLLAVHLVTADNSHNDVFRFDQKSTSKFQKSETAKKFHVEGPYFKDAHGRTLLFHGFNAVKKSFPWYPVDLFNETRLELYRNWGFNVVRLGTMWAGAQPDPLYYNETYLMIMSDIIGRLNEYGINVILDMHQDVLCSKFQAYDGVPQWVVEKLPPPDHAFPWPLPRELQWSDGYITEAVSQAFQAIYKNANGSADDLAAFWKKIALTFKRFDNVLGYELMNEPWAGDIYHDLSLLIPGVAGKKNLKPLYDRINAALREADPDGIIFYEPVTWGVFFNGTAIGSGFDSVPGGPEYKDRSCLAYHYYCWAIGGDEHQHYSFLKRAICDQGIGPRVFSAVNTDIQATGGTSFLTEFGLCVPDGNVNSTGTQECAFVMEQADQNFQSWTYWDSMFFNETTGAIDENVVNAFARVYPRAIAGHSIKFHFEPHSKIFHLTFSLDPKIQIPSEIFVPILQYPNGFKVQVSRGFKWYYDIATQVLNVWKPEENQVYGSVKCVVKVYPFMG